MTDGDTPPVHITASGFIELFGDRLLHDMDNMLRGDDFRECLVAMASSSGIQVAPGGVFFLHAQAYVHIYEQV